LPPRLALTPDQFARCYEALGFFRQKLSNPLTITQEFARLQVGSFGCSLFGSRECVGKEKKQNSFLKHAGSCCFLLHES